MKHLLPLLIILLPFFTSAQISFSDTTGLLVDDSFQSYQPTMVADMNGDRKDDIIRVSNGNLISIEYQTNAGAPFTNHNFQNPSSAKPWGMAVADVNQDGFNDFVAGGSYDGIRVYTSSNGTSFSPDVLQGGSIFLQGINFVDINNDGFSDIFACHDDATSKSYRNVGPGSFVDDPTLITTAAYAGNYGSVWSDYDNDGDVDLYISKCRLGVTDPTDPRRINGLYQNNGDGTFSEVAGTAGVADGEQSWSADFGDIDNDGDLDLFVLNHTGNNHMYEQVDLSSLVGNTGSEPTSGSFSNITNSGISTDGSADWQSVFADFDNDGFVDLLVSGAHAALYMNNGNRTFTASTSPFPSGTIRNFAVGDLNHDGFLDIYATYGAWAVSNSRDDRLLFNDKNSNNWVAFDLTGTVSNINGIGAKLKLYGGWGIQIREVRSGESYGIMNTLTQHFGLGTSTQIDSLVIKWPSGISQKITNLPVNQFVSISESPTLLAVDLLGFSAVASENYSVDLEWITSSEEDHEYFMLERSKDGNEFEDLFRVEGVGDSDTQTKYRYVDYQPLFGYNYYRLKIVDGNGEVAYSDVQVVKIKFEEDQKFSVKAAPTLLAMGQEISVTILNPEARDFTLSLWSVSGNLILSEQFNSGQQLMKVDIDQPVLNPGVYYLMAEDGKNREVVELIIAR